MTDNARELQGPSDRVVEMRPIDVQTVLAWLQKYNARKGK